MALRVGLVSSGLGSPLRRIFGDSGGKGRTMRWVLGLIAAAGVLSGCAAEDRPQPPSFAGLSGLAAVENVAYEPNPATAENEMSSAARHVRSNKLLGALAYQKVTGRTIAPERLSDRD